MDKAEILKRANEALSLMKRMGESVDTSTVSLLKENLNPSVIINEGLIKSYDIDSVISFIGNAFGLDNPNKKIKLSDEIFSDLSIDLGHCGKIWKHNDSTVAVKLYELCLYKRDKLDFYFRKYGYILSNVDTDPNGKNTLFYEKKFPEEIRLYQLLRYTDCLYHVTNAKNKESILKKGIRTKSADDENGFMHDERIYLFINHPDKHWIDFLGWGDPLIIRVNITKLPDTYALYVDRRADNALYTFENIPKETIEIIKTN